MEQLASRRGDALTPTEGTAAPCPNWCFRHAEFDQGTPDHGLIHYGTENEAAGYSVRLSRCDSVGHGVPGEVIVHLDDEHLTAQRATALAGLLATTASKAEADEQTIVRTLDLPEGQDYVLYRDMNIVAVSSRLDEAGRERALTEAGVR